MMNLRLNEISSGISGDVSGDVSGLVRTLISLRKIAGIAPSDIVPPALDVFFLAAIPGSNIGGCISRAVFAWVTMDKSRVVRIYSLILRGVHTLVLCRVMRAVGFQSLVDCVIMSNIMSDIGTSVSWDIVGDIVRNVNVSKGMIKGDVHWGVSGDIHWGVSSVVFRSVMGQISLLGNILRNIDMLGLILLDSSNMCRIFGMVLSLVLLMKPLLFYLLKFHLVLNREISDFTYQVMVGRWLFDNRFRCWLNPNFLVLLYGGISWDIGGLVSNSTNICGNISGNISLRYTCVISW